MQLIFAGSLQAFYGQLVSFFQIKIKLMLFLAISVEG